MAAPGRTHSAAGAFNRRTSCQTKHDRRPGPMTTAIHARNLTRHYGSTKAVDGIDLDIPAGRIVGLIGPNGAGKTTALKAVLGLTRYRGRLKVLGRRPDQIGRASCRDRMMK